MPKKPVAAADHPAGPKRRLPVVSSPGSYVSWDVHSSDGGDDKVKPFLPRIRGKVFQVVSGQIQTIYEDFLMAKRKVSQVSNLVRLGGSPC